MIVQSQFKSMLRESMRMTLEAIRQNKLRAILTLLGISIGVFSVIGVMTAIRTLETSIESGLNVFGTNTFFIQKTPAIQFGRGGRSKYRNRKNIDYQQYELLKEFEISKDVQIKIVNYANEKNITIFSAPSHMNDLEIMKKMELPIFKIGSDLACHTPLLKEIGNLNKPIILSTGMCSLDEVRSSVNTILSTGNNQLAI